MEKIGFKIDDCRTYTINEILERVSKPVNVERDKEYSQIGIRSFGKGLFYKESVTGEELGNKSVFWIEPDCFILNIVFAWEQAIGKTTQKELGMIASHRFPMYRPNLSKVDLDYLIYFFLTKTGKEILELSSPGGAGRNKTLGQDIFLNSSITLPPLSVQKLNGLILAKIDSLIQAKTQKLESLKAVKKSLLQKCFPKDGEKVPQMRFEGFSGEWEEKKLGEVADLFDYGLNASAKEFDGSNKYLRITDIDDETRIFQSFDLTSPNCDLRYCNSSLLCEQDIVFARTGASVGKTFLYNSSDGTVYFAGFLIRARIKEEYDRTFIFQNTLSEKYNKYIQITSQRSGQPGVNAEEYKEFSFRIPTLVEQQKIEQFFSKYDSLISLQQKEIDNLKTIKKSLLQKMFV